MLQYGQVGMDFLGGLGRLACYLIDLLVQSRQVALVGLYICPGGIHFTQVSIGLQEGLEMLQYGQVGMDFLGGCCCYTRKVTNLSMYIG